MDIYEDIRRNLLEGKAEETTGLVKKALALCYPPESILKDGLVLGAEMLAYKFHTRDVFIPEAIMVARTFNAAVSCLGPYLKKNHKSLCRAVIGTVEGDCHDIGKNLVKTYISTLDLEIVDLGVDVSKEAFVQAVREYKPRLLLLSALLTTTIEEMRCVIRELEKQGLRRQVRIFVGGLPVTEEFAKEIGADYYSRDAIELRNFLEKNLSRLVKEI